MPAPLPLTIRPFDPADYERVTEISNLNDPDHPGTADEKRESDAKRDAKFLFACFVAENDAGEIIAVGTYGQNADSHHPRKFGVRVGVHPGFRRSGVGTRLYQHILSELERYKPILLRAHGQENQPATLAFLAKNGYVETMREWESCLLPELFDPAPFAGIAESLATQGIVIRTLREAEGDENRDRRLYDLDCAVVMDMPSSEPIGVATFADWHKNTLEVAHLLPDGFFIAVDTRDNDRYIGVSQLWSSAATAQWYTGLTGVLPEYRGRKIALALKVRAAIHAKENNVPAVRTWNAQVNRAMLSINEKLGFVKQPAWINFQNQVLPEPILVRQATPRDYDAIAHIHSTVWHEFPETASELRHGDETRSETVRHDRFIAEVDGKPVAVAEYGQHLGEYDPRKFDLHIAVLPEFQGRGYGAAMYEHLFTALRPFAPHTFTAYTFSDRERAVRFLAERGFDIVQIEQTSKLDPRTFDPVQYTDGVAKIAAQGIMIRPYAAWKETVPDLPERLHELHWTIEGDVPHTGERTRLPLAEFVKRFDEPRFLPDGAFYAFDTATDEFVGMSLLWGNGTNSELHTGTTGVLRSHRKRGIATALKVHALKFAKNRGAEAVWTSNEVSNTGMLGINARFGFEKQPNELQYEKRIPTNE